MKEIVNFLDQSDTHYFATIGLDGKPKVRPFRYMFEENQKIWFCTSNQKDVYKEMNSQPYIELCASGKGMSWLRLSGKAVFSDSLEVKEKVFEKSPLVKGIYKTPDNPDFEVFYLEEVSAAISGLGKAPVIYKF